MHSIVIDRTLSTVTNGHFNPPHVQAREFGDDELNNIINEVAERGKKDEGVQAKILLHALMLAARKVCASSVYLFPSCVSPRKNAMFIQTQTATPAYQSTKQSIAVAKTTNRTRPVMAVASIVMWAMQDPEAADTLYPIVYEAAHGSNQIAWGLTVAQLDSFLDCNPNLASLMGLVAGSASLTYLQKLLHLRDNDAKKIAEKEAKKSKKERKPVEVPYPWQMGLEMRRVLHWAAKTPLALQQEMGLKDVPTLNHLEALAREQEQYEAQNQLSQPPPPPGQNECLKGLHARGLLLFKDKKKRYATGLRDVGCNMSQNTLEAFKGVKKGSKFIFEALALYA